VLPDGFRFRTADEAGPEAAVQAHVDAWAPSTYTAEGYEGVRRTATYRGDLHVLVEAPDGTMAASTIMWLDEANKTAEFEPVGTHPGYRRRGLGTAMLLHGMHLAREAGATHMTVACLGAPGHPRRAGCTTASASGSSRGTRRSSSPDPDPRGSRPAHQPAGAAGWRHAQPALPLPRPHRRPGRTATAASATVPGSPADEPRRRSGYRPSRSRRGSGTPRRPPPARSSSRHPAADGWPPTQTSGGQRLPSSSAAAAITTGFSQIRTSPAVSASSWQRSCLRVSTAGCPASRCSASTLPSAVRVSPGRPRQSTSEERSSR
jgi:GNAT superfamily N-acetyltransferase